MFPSLRPISVREALLHVWRTRGFLGVVAVILQDVVYGLCGHDSVFLNRLKKPKRVYLYVRKVEVRHDD